MTTLTLAIAEEGDLDGIYINNNLVHQDNSISAEIAIHYCIAQGVNRYDILEVPEAVFANSKVSGKFPDYLPDLVREIEKSRVPDIKFPFGSSEGDQIAFDIPMISNKFLHWKYINGRWTLHRISGDDVKCE